MERYKGNVRLIGLDLDGTLLNEQKQLTPRTKAALKAAMEAGIELVPVTGRPEKGIPFDLRRLNDFHYSITSNGAMIYGFRGKVWEPIVSYYVPLSDAFRILNAARDRGYMRNAFVDGYGYSSRGHYEKVLESFRGTPLEQYILDSRRPDDNFEQFMRRCGERTENIWIRTGSKEEADAFEAEILETCHVHTLRTLPQDIECVNMCADKGDALMYVAKRLGIPSEQVMAIGDSENDIGLLQHVGIPVAMGNATDRVKALTDWVCSDNEHDGVAEVIEAIL